MSFNKIIIIGNLGRNPELRYTPQGKPVCDFTVATSEKRKDGDKEAKEETTWFRVTFWDRLAEIASQYLTKGKQVYIEGRLSTREWTSKEGRTHVSLEVRGTELQMLGSRGEETSQAATATAIGTPTKAVAKSTEPNITDEDIPF